MRRQSQFSGPNVNSHVSGQMQHLTGQRGHHNPGLDGYGGRSDAGSVEQQYMSSKPEAQWQWDGKDPMGPSSLASQIYKEGQTPETGNSFYQGRRQDINSGSEKPTSKDAIAPSDRSQDMEIGYDDRECHGPDTFEALEQKFMDEISRLTNEVQDAEDRENARHQEIISEINKNYQEKLNAARALQKSHREDFLHREAQQHQQQYQQAAMRQFQHGSAGNADFRNYGGALAEAHQGYSDLAYDAAYRERAQLSGNASHNRARDPGYDPRGQYPGGRVYDSNPRYY